jgi:hypothetical protein
MVLIVGRMNFSHKKAPVGFNDDAKKSGHCPGEEDVR